MINQYLKFIKYFQLLRKFKLKLIYDIINKFLNIMVEMCDSMFDIFQCW